MNEWWKALLVGIGIGVVVCGASLFWIYQGRLRDSNAIIVRMEAENRELDSRLASIQGAVDGVAGALSGAAVETGEIADGIGGVIAGLDDFERIFRELADFVVYIEGVLLGGNAESP